MVPVVVIVMMPLRLVDNLSPVGLGCNERSRKQRGGDDVFHATIIRTRAAIRNGKK